LVTPYSFRNKSRHWTADQRRHGPPGRSGRRDAAARLHSAEARTRLISNTLPLRLQLHPRAHARANRDRPTVGRFIARHPCGAHRQGNRLNAVTHWSWRSYPGCRPGEIRCGTAQTYELAKIAGERAFASTRTEVDFDAFAINSAGQISGTARELVLRSDSGSLVRSSLSCASTSKA
jgi:hypothetical protein